MISRNLAGLLVAGAAIAALFAAPMPSWAASADADDGREISCLALTIYHEARGESERGQLAVGHVVMNRTRSALFPASVCDVVRQGGQQRAHCQFSWWCDGRSDRPKDEAALLAEETHYGCTRDPTAGALWYHSPPSPSWSKSFGPGKWIDRHVATRRYHRPSNQRICSSPEQVRILRRHTPFHAPGRDAGGGGNRRRRCVIARPSISVCAAMKDSSSGGFVARRTARRLAGPRRVRRQQPPRPLLLQWLSSGRCLCATSWYFTAGFNTMPAAIWSTIER